MTALVWDQVGERTYETGVDHGVLYVADDSGDYPQGVPWSGLTTVTETPAGADSNKQYADNIVYLNLLSAETWGGTIEALTFPDEFYVCDGSAEPTPGVFLHQQKRHPFGFVYRTRIGNDLDDQVGYKLHLFWNALASPSQKANATVNDTPAPVQFSWTVSTTAVAVGTIDSVEYRPLSTMTIDSTKVDATALAALEAQLFGDSTTTPNLPTPAAVVAMFSGTVTEVNLGVAANQPSYNSSTHVVTIPAVTGVTWTINDVDATPGAQPAMSSGDVSVVEAHPADTAHTLTGDTDWLFDY
jgi:hypothetical protein